MNCLSILFSVCVCFTQVLLIVLCYFYLYVVLFPLWATELSNQHVNNKN
jgi:hypothetical protein